MLWRGEGAAAEISLGAGNQLSIAVQLPSDVKNNVRGLLGNYNGIASDDLINRAGQTIPADSDERTIHYDFGETCELVSAEKTQWPCAPQDFCFIVT